MAFPIKFNRLNLSLQGTLLTLVLCFASPALLRSQDCRKLLIDYITKMASFKQQGNTDVYYLHFGISTRLRDKSSAPVPYVDAKLYLTKDASFFESGVISIYNDPTDLICLDHNRKQIIRTKGGDAASMQNYSVEQLVEMQKKLIEGGNIVTCVDTVINSMKTKLIVLIASPDIRASLKVAMVTYYYFPDKEMMGKVRIDYVFEHMLDNQVIEYKAIDFRYLQWKTNKAAGLVFDNAGRIKPKYAQYSLIDKRK